MNKAAETKFRFVVCNQDPNANEADIVKRLQKATANAVTAARPQFQIEAITELEGGFAGLGETAVILAVLHAAKAGAESFTLGALAAAGKTFFDDFLAPRLRKLNLLPVKLEPIPGRTEPLASRKGKKKSIKRS